MIEERWRLDEYHSTTGFNKLDINSQNFIKWHENVSLFDLSYGSSQPNTIPNI